MSALFINGSPNTNGNTARLAALVLRDADYETINLTQVKVYPYGSNFDDDQFNEVVAALNSADDIVIGSPMYWHNICGAVRNVLDRSYGVIPEGSLSGKRLWFVFQGAAPTREQLKAADYTMHRFADVCGLEYMGMITNAADAARVRR